MAGIVLENERTTIPAWVGDPKSFLRWADSPAFPTVGRYSFIRGQVHVDLSLEQLLIHNRLKVRITSALDTLATTFALGYVFGDRARLRNTVADLSVEPDITFVSYEARRTGRVTLV